MRKRSPETELRYVRSRLTDQRKLADRLARDKRTMLIGLERLCKVMSVTMGSLPPDDPWRPHFELWISELQEIKKENGLFPVD